jgi:hypothetical protein
LYAVDQHRLRHVVRPSVTLKLRRAAAGVEGVRKVVAARVAPKAVDPGPEHQNRSARRGPFGRSIAVFHRAGPCLSIRRAKVQTPP